MNELQQKQTTDYVTASPQVSSTMDGQVEQPPKSHKKLIIAIILLIVLGVGGFFAYKYKNNLGISFLAGDENAAWEKFLSSTLPKTYSAKFDLKWSGQFINGRNGYVSFSPVVFANSGEIYNDIGNSTTTQAKISSDISSDVSALTDWGRGDVEYILKDGAFYFSEKTKNTESWFKELEGQWVKTHTESIFPGPLTLPIANFNRLSDYEDRVWPEIFIPTMPDVWTDPRYFKKEKFIGKEKLSDQDVFHFTASLNNQRLRTDRKDRLTNGASTNELEEIEHYLHLLETQIDNVSHSTFDVWLNPSGQLIKIELDAQVPVLENLSHELEAQVEYSGDIRRLKDIAEIGNKLSINFDGYPEGKNGQPANLLRFGNEFPKPPPTSGTCTDYYNTYWYESTGKSKIVDGERLFDSYSVTFCLAEGISDYNLIGLGFGINTTQDYAPGIGRLTPQGIKTGIACPGTPEQCSGPEHPKVSLNDVLALPSVRSDYRLTVEFTDIGKTKKIEAPKDFTDITDPQKAQEFLLRSVEGLE